MRCPAIAATRRGSRVRPLRGVALLELVISAGLMVLALGIAAQILVASQQRMARAVRGLENVSLDLVLARLRHDVRDARSVSTPTTVLWSHDGLVLETMAGDRVRWLMEAGTLVRELRRRTSSGIADQRQVVLRDVATFRWRRPPTPHRPLVEIELVDRASGHRIGTVSPATGAPLPPVLRHRALRVAVRGIGGRVW